MDRQDIFEIDRSHVVAQLRIIRRAINEGAEEMEMVAIEKVFVNSVSQALTRTARKLYQLAEDLSGLHRMIERASLPKEPERSNLEPPHRSLRKGRN
jgi:deoxyribose-phosphate aldolase